MKLNGTIKAKEYYYIGKEAHCADCGVLAYERNRKAVDTLLSGREDFKAQNKNPVATWPGFYYQL